MNLTRFSRKEMSIERILSAIGRRVMDFPHFLSWYFPTHQIMRKREQLYQFSNRHFGQRCFIIGNGPSIAEMDLSPLKGEFTFGLNRIYLAFDKLSFRPTYYVCVNELVLEQFADEIDALDIPKFLNWSRRKHFDFSAATTNFVKLSLSISDDFATSFNLPIFSGGTVTYVALQIAYIMGFSEVILIGVDHSFSDSGTPNKVEIREAVVDKNHFHPNYFPKGIKWQLPDLRRSEQAYSLARTYYEKDERRIIDATKNGKCTVFEKADFSSLF